MKRIFLIISLIVSISTFAQQKVSHDKFDKILRKHVDGNGMVNYFQLKVNKHLLDSYLEMISKNPPQKSWTKNERLAYWINAYNAFTLKLVITHYPIKSIRDIGSSIQVPFVNSPWDVKFIKIGGETYDLNNIEHSIIRKRFDEPRIHFALVCAAVSCPKLLNRAYFPKTLDKQLEQVAIGFLNNSSKNQVVSEGKVELSKLFSWYKGDFTKKTDLISYINQYTKKKVKENAKISYKNYNWALNDQKNR